MSIRDEGTVSFRLNHADKDWATNNSGYTFDPVQLQGITVWAVKRPDKTIEFHVAGPLGRELLFDGKVSEARAEGLNVTVTWKPTGVQLFLDGKAIGMSRGTGTADKPPAPKKPVKSKARKPGRRADA